MSQNSKNALFNAIGFIVPALILLITTPYLIEKLSIEVYGIYILIMSTVGLLSFIDLGFGQGVIKFVSHFYAKRDFEKINKVIYVSILINGVMGLLGAVLIFLFSSLLYELLNVKPQYRDITVLSLKISSAAFFFMLINGVFSNILRAINRYDIVVKAQIIIYISYSMLMIYILHIGGNLIHITFLYSISKIIESITFLYLAKKYLAYISLLPEWDTKIFKEISSFSIFTAMNSLTGNMTFRADKIILSNILGTEAVAYYNIAFMVLQTVNSFLTNVIQFLFPKVSELNSLSLKDELRAFYMRYFNHVTAISILMYFILLIWGDLILSIWLGKEVASKVVNLLPVISFVFFFLTVSNVAYYFYNGLGLSKINMVSSLIGTLAYLAALFFLAHIYGLKGASFSFIFILLPFPIYHYIMANLLDINRMTYFLYLLKSLLIFLLSFLLFYTLKIHLFLLKLDSLYIILRIIVTVSLVFMIFKVYELKRNLDSLLSSAKVYFNDYVLKKRLKG